MTQLESGQKVRIVIAEDESLIRIDLAEMLTELGYDVVATAADGESAIELVAKLAPDIALLDIKMPKMDGLTAAERIGELGGTAVVMLTAFSQGELVDRARAAGAMGFLVKPVTASDLTPTLELARARFAERTALETEVEDLNQRLLARKAVDRAKAILQQRFAMGEADAFRWLQKAAMDRRMSMQAVAEVVIAESSALP
ncbi:MAG: ANTAR domain-containing response regulator [Candidatus Nanopelagicales bacterium]